MCHGREWHLPLPPHTNRKGGADGPWVGPPEPLAQRRPTGWWWGPPVRGSSPRHPPSTGRDPLSPPGPPPVPHPGWGGAARARFEPAPPLVVIYGQCGPPGERRGPALPRAPPPTTAGARGLAAPSGLLCRGGEATGRFIPAPNWGLCPRHREQSPVGGYLTATHHRTTGTRER